MAPHVVIDDAHVYPRRRPFKEDAEDALEQRPVGDAEIFDEDELFRRPQAGEDVVEQQAAGRKIAGVGAGKGGETFSYAVWDKALDGVKDMYGKYKSVKLGRGNVQVQAGPMKMTVPRKKIEMTL